MEMEIAERNGVVTACLIGHLWERSETCTIEDRLAAPAAERMRCVVVDMQRLTFINSAGVGGLIRTYSRLKQKGVRMLVYRPRGNVRETLELVAVGSILRIVAGGEELAEALQDPDLVLG